VPGFEITLEDQLAEVDRELRLRESHYPRWTKGARPKLTQGNADLQIARLRAVRSSLEELVRIRPALVLMAEASMRDWQPGESRVVLHFSGADAVLEFMKAFDAARYGRVAS
jgi:hypothetical protein